MGTCQVFFGITGKLKESREEGRRKSGHGGSSAGCAVIKMLLLLSKRTGFLFVFLFFFVLDCFLLVLL